MTKAERPYTPPPPPTQPQPPDRPIESKRELVAAVDYMMGHGNSGNALMEFKRRLAATDTAVWPDSASSYD